MMDLFLILNGENNEMKYLYMSFLLALVYSCSDSGDNSDYSEMLKKDFNQEIKWDVDSLALMRASWEKRI